MIAYRAVSSVTQTSATSLTLTVPSTAEMGDLLLAVLHVDGGSGITITPPAGWELVLRTDDSTTETTAVYRCRKVSGLAETHVFTFTSAACVAHMLAYGGVDQVTAVDVSGGQANASSASCTAPSITPTKTNAQLVWIGGAATGARTATPPSGFTERADSQGAALAASVADNLQATIGVSSTKVGTLSGAAANVGTLLALAPSALNTPVEVRDHANWRYDPWGPNISSDTEFSAYVEALVQEANVELRVRVGGTWYADNVLMDPWRTVLKKAEMHLSQAALYGAAAGIAESGGDSDPNKFLGTGDQLRSLSTWRSSRAEEQIRLCLDAQGKGRWVGYASTSATTGHVRPMFDDEDGLSE